MSDKRIIPCMDIRGGRVVKGRNFQGIREVDDPVALARYYNAQGADELVFYDIAASVEGRDVFTDLLSSVIDEIQIPLMVAGNIHSLDDIDRVLALGGSKVSINTGAIRDPSLIPAAARKFGSEVVVLSMDIKAVNGAYHLFTRAGSEDTGIDALDFARRGAEDGAGALVVNSIDTDGVKEGFDLELLAAVLRRVRVPVIASGGAGSMEHFAELFTALPDVDAGLAASVFHYKEVRIPELKKYLLERGIQVRME